MEIRRDDVVDFMAMYWVGGFYKLSASHGWWILRAMNDGDEESFVDFEILSCSGRFENDQGGAYEMSYRYTDVGTGVAFGGNLPVEFSMSVFVGTMYDEFKESHEFDTDDFLRYLTVNPKAYQGRNFDESASFSIVEIGRNELALYIGGKTTARYEQVLKGEE